MGSDKDDKKPLKTKELDFVVCPIHGIRYPKGGQCPQCQADSQR